MPISQANHLWDKLSKNEEVSGGMHYGTNTGCTVLEKIWLEDELSKFETGVWRNDTAEKILTGDKITSKYLEEALVQINEMRDQFGISVEDLLVVHVLVCREEL